LYDEAKLSSATTYYVKAVDTGGRQSDNAATTVVTPTSVGPVINLIAKVIDNNVLIDWETPTSLGSYPIEYYNIYKGPSATAPYFLGRVYGTFFTWFTQAAEESEFWVEPVDTAGTKGTATSKSFVIYPPPDYLLISDDSPDIVQGDLTNALAEGTTSFLAATVSGESWEDRFVNNSMSNIQGFVTAGYGPYATPSEVAGGYWEKEIDLGVVVAGSRISLFHSLAQVSGFSTVTTKISYKKLSGDAWTDTSGLEEVYAAEFQFIKLRLEVDNDDAFALARISGVSYSVNVKKQTDSGEGTSLSSGLERVYFNLPYLSVTSIIASPRGDGSEGFSEVIVFAGGANPEYFDIAFFDVDGTQTALDFSWTVEGIINPVT
jgi:hypothetical protein